MPLLIRCLWCAASDKDKNKGSLGCEDRDITHEHADSDAIEDHPMTVCMPGEVSQGERAQQYWAAHEEFDECLQDMEKTAAQCADVTMSSFMSQLEVLGMTPPGGMEEAMCDAATFHVA